MRVQVRFFTFLLIQILFLSNQTFSQSYNPKGNIRFNHLTKEDGLSDSFDWCILQDSKGFIWIGTSDGLDRYDGRSFKLFKYSPDDVNSLGANTIRALYEDKSGIIVGDNGGGAFRLSNTGGLEELNQVYSNLLTTGSELYSVRDISPDGNLLVGSGRIGITGQDEGYLLSLSGSTSVDGSQTIPGSFTLNQNYPNPFNPITMIRYTIPKLTNVQIKIHNSLGKLVRILLDEEKPAGNYTVTWDGKDNHESVVASGVYFYRLEATGKTNW